MTFLKLPIDFDHFLKGGALGRCSYEESIAQHLMLLITSRYGEVVGKGDYGSAIWELEFNQLVKINEWEEVVRNSLIEVIDKYEKRIEMVNVQVILSEINDDMHHRKDSYIRRKASINISAELVGMNLPFHFNTIVYISPLAQ
ncbi:MAG: GPW/gp25 family protein [Prolixibacteraceae bacterium]|jgi:phage baseplate assembly protein W|nr:GPW/gp25 family protein [Prolixibacteraceae bacterium]